LPSCPFSEHDQETTAKQKNLLLAEPLLAKDPKF